MSIIKRDFKVTGGDLREIIGRVIQSVFDLSSALEETEGLMMGIPEHASKIRKMISKVISDYPQSQIELVLECLIAESSMDTAEEALESMADSDDEDKE